MLVNRPLILSVLVSSGGSAAGRRCAAEPPLSPVRRHLLRAAAATLALTPVLLALTPAAIALALGRIPAT